MLRDVFITNFNFDTDGFDAVTGYPVSITVTYTDNIVEKFEYSKASDEVQNRIREQQSLSEITQKIIPLSPWAKNYLSSIL